MPSDNQTPFLVRHPDDDYIDEVRIRTIYRYKTSGLSGDEWRTSVVLELIRKGMVMNTETVGSLNAATARLPWSLLTLLEQLPHELREKEEARKLCMQPGCAEPATNLYQLKQQYCNSGHPSDPPFPMYRQFCNRHARRGDCGLEDSDANYIVIQSGYPGEPRPEDISPSGQMVVQVDSLDDIGPAVAQAMRQINPNTPHTPGEA